MSRTALLLCTASCFHTTGLQKASDMVSLLGKYQDPSIQKKQELALVCFRSCGLCSEGLFEQRMWYHKQNKWDLNLKWPRKPFKTYISYIYFGAGVRWCGVGGSKGRWRNPLTKLLLRWEWKEPIIALWRIKTTSANSPNICVVPQSGNFTASGFLEQINSAEVYKGGLAPLS